MQLCRLCRAVSISLNILQQNVTFMKITNLLVFSKLYLQQQRELQPPQSCPQTDSKGQPQPGHALQAAASDIGNSSQDVRFYLGSRPPGQGV